MSQIRFNPKALGFAIHAQGGDMGHSGQLSAAVTVMISDPSIEPLMKRLGFAYIECFPASRGDLPAKNIDP